MIGTNRVMLIFAKEVASSKKAAVEASLVDISPGDSFIVTKRGFSMFDYKSLGENDSDPAGAVFKGWLVLITQRTRRTSFTGLFSLTLLGLHGRGNCRETKMK